MVWWIGEQAARTLITLDDAIGVTEEMFSALDDGRSTVFPATRGQGSDPSTRFGVKAGFDGTHRQPGLKIGTYWPANVARGLANHGSTTLLLDDDTGALQAMVASTHLTALRTAAMNAVAVKHLARVDASCLALFGTGHQAYFDALAISRVRKIERILVCGRRDDAAHSLALRLREAGLPASVDKAESAVPLADIISTVTASRAPLFDASWVAPGCHVASMGSDGPGKQELPPDLLRRASAWADLPVQSVVMGEFQHAVSAGILDSATIKPLSGVVSGRIAGRGHAEEITAFDSSGIALQDLAIAQLLLVRARQTGQAGWIDLG